MRQGSSKRPWESSPARCTRLQAYKSHRSENRTAERADRFHSRSVTSPLPLYTHALSPLIDALLAGPSILAFAILLSASFAAQLDELRSPSNMNTFFAPRNTPRTRSLIVTLQNKTPPAIHRPRHTKTNDAPFYYPDDNSDKPTWPARSLGGSEEQTRAEPHRSASPS